MSDKGSRNKNSNDDEKIIDDKNKDKDNNDDKNKDNNDDQKIIEGYLNLNNDRNKISPTYDDEDLEDNLSVVYDDDDLRKSDIKSVKDHNEYYTELLKSYVNNANANLKNKIIYKKIFFYICCCIMLIVMFVILILTIKMLDSEVDRRNLIISIVSNLISFLVTFIVLPKTIAEHLFNNEDEKNMVDIVKSIQDYDKQIRNDLKKNN